MMGLMDERSRYLPLLRSVIVVQYNISTILLESEKIPKRKTSPSTVIAGILME
jgi:hypothetical protein